MYYHHYPQNQFMTEEEAEHRNYVPHHPYHRYYETHYMGQPLVSRFMIPHLPQQRPMIPPHKAIPVHHPSFFPTKLHQEMPYIVQDENINIFNVKSTQHQECLGVSRKGISKKNNAQKNIVHPECSPKQKKQTEVVKAKMQKKEQSNRVPLKKMANGTRGTASPHQQVFSSDPLIRSLQQLFPSVKIDSKISTDNATLDQIDEVIQNIPSFYNNQMRETMKCLTYNQEKLVCNKIKEYKPVDVFDEIVKISPEFDLKGLSMEQLNEKLQSINNKFEESQQKYQIMKQQEKEALQRQQQQEEDDNNVQIYIKELKKKENRDNLQKSEETPRFQNTSHSFEKSIASIFGNIKNEDFQNISKLEVHTQKNKSSNNLNELNSMKEETNVNNVLEVEELIVKPAMSFSCAQYSSPKKEFSENMNEENKLSILASRSDRRRILMIKNHENSGHSGNSHSQAKLLGINGNINNFISPFRPTISNNIDGLSPNPKKILQKSASHSCSSFKKTECQFMDYIDNVIVNADGTFGDDDIFHKNDGVTIFNNNNNKSNSDNKSNRSENGHNSYMAQQNQSQLHLHVHHHHYLDNSIYQNSKKKYFDSNRIHNFIADEEDYENIQPFAITQFNGSNSQSYHNSLQQMMSNSNQKPYQQCPTYNISSFLREIDDINAFNQPGFL